MGIDILTKDISLGNQINGTLSIWDVTGEKVFDVVKDLYRREEGIALIVFDLTKLKTCEQMNKYLSGIRHFDLEEYPYVLIGKKPFFLKKDSLLVYSIDAKLFAESEGCVYLEVSSQTSNDIDNIFNRLAKKILTSKVPV